MSDEIINNYIFVIFVLNFEAKFVFEFYYIANETIFVVTTNMIF